MKGKSVSGPCPAGPRSTEILGYGGWDFAVIDMEHGSSISLVEQCILGRPRRRDDQLDPGSRAESLRYHAFHRRRGRRGPDPQVESAETAQ